MASDNVSKIVDAVSGLSVLQLSELVTQLQDKLGVTAMPMAAAAAPAAAGADAGAAAEAAGGGTVLITGSGDNKIAVIKALREINPNLGLQEAKGMTENLPAEVMKDGNTEDAKAAAEKLTAAGATVEVK